MFEKKSVIASAILAGLVSGIALADEAAAPAAPAEGAKMEKKNECKGKKNECKGHQKKHGKKKGAKDACSGPNGCDGKDMKKDAEKPAEAPKAE